MPQVSIIIPVFNVAPYITKCLQSVASQTYKKAIECLIIDDCGQDNSISLAESFINNYNKDRHDNNIEFRILHHKYNRGLSAARNTGLENANGEWIYFLDSDDWITPECIELMMKCTLLYTNIEAVFAGTTVSTGAHGYLDYEKNTKPLYTDNRELIARSMLKRIVYGMTAWNKLIKKNIIIHNNISFVDGLIHEDEVWNFDLAKVLTKIAFVNTNTYYYLKREGSIVSEKVKQNQIIRKFILWHELLKHIYGYQKQDQIKALSGWIIEEMHKDFIDYNRKIFCLFTLLAIKAHSSLSFYLMIQGLLGLFKHQKFNNHKIVKHISL